MPMKDHRPGDALLFGRYPQTEDSSLLPISWTVLDVSSDSALLLSDRILDCRRYHGNSAGMKWRDCSDTTWRDCDLRAWLKDEFYSSVFSSAEKTMIRLTHCSGNGTGSPDTDDYAFLLSAEEARAHLARHGKQVMKSVGTPFARLPKPDGCRLYVYDKSNEDNYAAVDGKMAGCSWWWLRTQGNKPSRACFVGTGCSIRSYENVSVSRAGIRPAIWIDASWRRDANGTG